MKKIFLLFCAAAVLTGCATHYVGYYNGKSYRLDTPVKTEKEATAAAKIKYEAEEKAQREEEQQKQKERLSAIWLGKKIYQTEDEKSFVIEDVVVSDKEYCMPGINYCGNNKYAFVLKAKSPKGETIEIKTRDNSDDILPASFESEKTRNERAAQKEKEQQAKEDVLKKAISATCNENNWETYKEAHEVFEIAQKAKISPFILITGTPYETRRVSDLDLLLAKNSHKMVFIDVFGTDAFYYLFGDFDVSKELMEKYYNKLINHLNSCYIKLK